MTDPGRAVFLSYASQDAEAAQQLCNALRAAGIEVWSGSYPLVLESRGFAIEYYLQSAELVVITEHPAAPLSGKYPCALDSVVAFLLSRQRASRF